MTFGSLSSKCNLKINHAILTILKTLKNRVNVEQRKLNHRSQHLSRPILFSIKCRLASLLKLRGYIHLFHKVNDLLSVVIFLPSDCTKVSLQDNGFHYDSSNQCTLDKELSPLFPCSGRVLYAFMIKKTHSLFSNFQTMMDKSCHYQMCRFFEETPTYYSVNISVLSFPP